MTDCLLLSFAIYLKDAITYSPGAVCKGFSETKAAPMGPPEQRPPGERKLSPRDTHCKITAEFKEDLMEPGNVINLATALLVLAAIIVLFRIFRGDLSDNKGGMVFAVVILGGMAYFIRTSMGRELVDHLFAIMR